MPPRAHFHPKALLPPEGVFHPKAFSTRRHTGRTSAVNEVARVFCTHFLEIADAHDKADRVKDIRFATPVEAGDD
jgi:hypothetical protein